MPARQTGGRDQLSGGLVAARNAAGLSQYEAAERAGTYQSKIARVELGKTLPDEEYVAQLCTAYRTPAAERRRLIQLARDVKAGNRRVVLHRNVAAFQRQVGRIQAQSTLIRSFASIGVPGMLQTTEYAHNLFASRPGVTPERAAAGAKARIENQAILDERTAQRRFVYLMSEGALGWAFGGPEVMATQMDHIAQATHRRNARVGIIPFGAWAPDLPLPLHGWEMYDERLAIVGTITATALLDEPGDIATYLDMFQQLEQLAAYDDQAREILTQVAHRYRTMKG
jgi:transcriptional regulator with XRE-family HTH domain